MGVALIIPAIARAAQDAEAAPTAPAASDAPADRARYEREYFTPFAPATALDMVQRLPGVALDGGDSDVRGFGGAAGNLVINGARPTSKSEGVQTILSRIPASRVLRVEVGSGDLWGSEFAGRAQVINVVTTADARLAGTATATLARDLRGRITPSADASALIKRGRSTFNVSSAFDRGRYPERGTDTITRIEPGTRRGDGGRIEFREKFNDGRDQGVRLAASWAYAGGDNRAANLNVRGQKRQYRLDQDNRVTPAAGPVRDDLLAQENDDWDFEVGGDVTRPLWGGGIKLIGLATGFRQKGDDLSLERVGDDTIVGGAFQLYRIERDESVLRLLWSRANLRGWSVETGVEGAFNRLDNDVELFGIDAGGARTRIDLPIDQAVVEEYRGEAFINAGRRLSPTLRLDAGLTFEASRLTVSGDTSAKRSLRFFKPTLTLDLRPTPRWHAQFSLRRTVAQLDFGDFVSAAELANDRIDAGNAELLPQRAWEARLTFDRPVLGDGTAKLELGYDRVSLIQDRVPTPEGFDAPGNLGTGRKAFANASFDLPLGRLGIKGGRVNFNVFGQHTAVRDPYTGRDRRFSGAIIWDFNLNFRQDLGRYAYGVGYYAQPSRLYFRRNEIDESNSDERFVNVFAEWRATPQSTLTLSVDNILNNPSRRFRTFFDPDRSNPQPVIFEDRERFQSRTLALRYRRNFG